MLRVTIENQTVEVENGKPSTITIDGRDRPLTVAVALYRTFNKSGVRFDYPADFRFRLEKPKSGEGSHYCVLEGDGIGIHIKHHVPKFDFVAFADYVREKHTNLPTNLHTVDECEVELRTANARFKGIGFELVGNIGGQGFRQFDQCFLLPSSNKDCCIFLIITTTGEVLSHDAVHSITVLQKSLIVEGNQ
jgi:hypothetical protein